MVQWKSGQPRWTALRRRVLGAGMLERARATALGLLGAVAAVGLAIAAIAFNQGWPLVPGGSIPRFPGPRQDVGAATAVARAHAGGAPAVGAGRSVRPRPSGSGAAARGGVSGGASPPSEVVAEPAPVVAASQPAGRTHPARHGAPHSHGKSPSPAQPTAPSSQPSPAAAPQPAPASAAEPEAAPVATPTPAQSPPATASEAPADESDTPPWSQGHGHAYGRSDGWHETGSADGGGWGGDDRGGGHSWGVDPGHDD